jgi:hypothetical protein
LETFAHIKFYPEVSEALAAVAFATLAPTLAAVPAGEEADVRAGADFHRAASGSCYGPF